MSQQGLFTQAATLPDLTLTGNQCTSAASPFPIPAHQTSYRIVDLYSGLCATAEPKVSDAPCLHVDIRTFRKIRQSSTLDHMKPVNETQYRVLLVAALALAFGSAVAVKATSHCHGLPTMPSTASSCDHLRPLTAHHLLSSLHNISYQIVVWHV